MEPSAQIAAILVSGGKASQSSLAGQRKKAARLMQARAKRLDVKSCFPLPASARFSAVSMKLAWLR